MPWCSFTQLEQQNQLNWSKYNYGKIFQVSLDTKKFVSLKSCETWTRTLVELSLGFEPSVTKFEG
jgi:hypothetical protein